MSPQTDGGSFLADQEILEDGKSGPSVVPLQGLPPLKESRRETEQERWTLYYQS